MANKIKGYILMSAATFLIGSCGSISYAPARIGQNYTIRRSPNDIEVFKTQVPNKKFIEIGSVNVCCGRADKLVNKLRELASKAGGDALLDIEPYAGDGLSAAVIRFQE